jgi:endoglucanase
VVHDDLSPAPLARKHRWLARCRFLARRYAANPVVLGADLHNAPQGRATWGDGNPATDWRLAAKCGGNAIPALAPQWYWWAGHLSRSGRVALA